MRVFVLLVTLLCLAASPALAQGNGQSKGNGHGSENSNGQGNGHDNGNGKESGNDRGGKNGNGGDPDKNSGNGNGQGNANNGNNGTGPGGGSSTGTSAAADNDADADDNGTIHYSQDHARDVVNAGRAVSLASLMPELQARSEGSVIDAELLNVQGILVYSVKVLRTDGRVTQEYYYAQSGRFIGSEP